MVYLGNRARGHSATESGFCFIEHGPVTAPRPVTQGALSGSLRMFPCGRQITNFQSHACQKQVDIGLIETVFAVLGNSKGVFSLLRCGFRLPFRQDQSC